MAEKKTPGRFTLQFNMRDPQQRSAADIINNQGRAKAQFITSAVLHYIHCPEIPDLMAVPVQISDSELEQRLLMLLKRHFPTIGQDTGTVFGESMGAQSDKHLPPAASEAEETFDGTELAAMYKTIAAFRGK